MIQVGRSRSLGAKMTTSKDIVEAFRGLFCQHKPEEHGEGRGRALERTGFYTQPLRELVAKTINPTVGQVLVPALPLISTQHDSNHREKEQETPHFAALAGLVELAAVIETDEEAKQLIENVVDLTALISEIADLPKDPASQRWQPWLRNSYPGPRCCHLPKLSLRFARRQTA